MNAASDAMPAVVAAFDCDGTLIRGDATLDFLLRLRGVSGLLLDLLTLVPALLRWRLGQLSTGALKQRLLGLAIQRARPRLAAALEPAEGATALIGRVRPAALERLRWHQRQDHQTVIVTASPRFLIEPLARQLGVPLLATETTDPLAAGPGQPFRLLSTNCKGPEKTRRLAAWLGRPLAEVQLHAYGDSRGDRELVQASGHPHWRSFTPAPRACPEHRPVPWAALLGGALLIGGMLGISRLSTSDRHSLAHALGSLSLWLPGIYSLLIAGYICRYWRWRVLLSCLGIGRACPPDALIWFRGFALTATPGKIGELSRIQELHQRLGYPKSGLLQVFVAERMADLASLVLLLLLVAPAELLQRWPDAADLIPALIPMLPALALTLAALGVALAKTAVRRFIARYRHHLPSGRLARGLPQAVLISLGAWGFESLILWLLVRELSPVSVSVPVAIAIYLLSGLAGQASSIPGGLGANEGATTLMLIQQNVPGAAALPIALLRRLLTVWSITLLAVALGGRNASVPSSPPA